MLSKNRNMTDDIPMEYIDGDGDSNDDGNDDSDDDDDEDDDGYEEDDDGGDKDSKDDGKDSPSILMPPPPAPPAIPMVPPPTTPHSIIHKPPSQVSLIPTSAPAKAAALLAIQVLAARQSALISLPASPPRNGLFYTSTSLTPQVERCTSRQSEDLTPIPISELISSRRLFEVPPSESNESNSKHPSFGED